MKWNRRFQGLTMFVFYFGAGSLEQSVKLGRLVILSISLAVPFSKLHFFKPTTKKQSFFSVFSFFVRFVCDTDKF